MNPNFHHFKRIDKKPTDEPKVLELLDDPGYNNYYCSLCGSHVFISDTPLDSMPRRKTDDSIIVQISKYFFRHYLRRDKLMVIKRDSNKYEKQFRFSCPECGVFVAYQSMNFDENDMTDENKRRTYKIFSHNKKKILYILIDAVVSDPRQSSLFIEMEKLKENQEKKNPVIGKSFGKLLNKE